MTVVVILNIILKFTYRSKWCLPCPTLCESEEEKEPYVKSVILLQFQAQAPDNLTLERGDVLYTDLSNQSVEGWLWSYAPTARKFGFVPRAYVGRRQ